MRIWSAASSSGQEAYSLAMILAEIGAVLGHRQLSTTTRYAHHSSQRMVETATAAARAWNLLPGPEVGAG